MKILPINYQTNQRNSKQSFGQIRPKHLFINSYGFKKNIPWAESAIEIIEKSKEKISEGVSFGDLIDFVSKSYNKIYAGNTDFGKPRDGVWHTCITSKYDAYKGRLKNIIDTEETEIVVQDIYSWQYGSLAKAHTMTAVLKNSNRKMELNKIFLLKENPEFGVHFEESPLWSNGDGMLVLSSPDIDVVKPVFEEVGLIYENILNKKEKPAKSVIEDISKEVGQIHWLISQTRPYGRGSAGIADILAKSIFEAKGIQVSSYKKDVNPNMEAFVLPMEKYSEEYKNFFSKPLRPIRASDIAFNPNKGIKR